MAKDDLASLVTALLDSSKADVNSRVSQLDADQIINLKVAVDDKDQELAASILDQTEKPQPNELDPRQSLREINRLGKKNLANNQPMDGVWELIGGMKRDDWRMAWPAIDENIMIALYNEAEDEDTDSVSADQSNKIYDYARQFVSEHVIYQNQLVEVRIQKGPHNTVGIVLDGKLKMVDKNEITHLDEHVMGMIAMPTLGRIKQLAGLAHDPGTTKSAPFEEFTEQTVTEAPEHVQRHLDAFLDQVSQLKSLLGDNPDYETAIMHCAGAKIKLSKLIAALEKADL
jgi:hypothetical protein